MSAFKAHLPIFDQGSLSSKVSLSWHRFIVGGFKLELLDQKENLIATLTPEKGGSNADGWIDDDATAQKYLVQLPEDRECIGCTVGLLFKLF